MVNIIDNLKLITIAAFVLPCYCLANETSLGLFSLTCQSPPWLENEDDVVNMAFDFEISNGSELFIERSIGDAIEISLWVPKPGNLDNLPDYFWLVLSTPSKNWSVVGQMHHYQALVGYAIKSEWNEVTSGWSDTVKHVNDEQDVLIYKDRTLPPSGADNIVRYFWQNSIKASYNHLINPSEADFMSISRGRDADKYDHFYSFEVFPENLDLHYEGLGHKVRLSKIVREKGTAFAFILDSEGRCLSKRSVEVR